MEDSRNGPNYRIISRNAPDQLNRTLTTSDRTARPAFMHYHNAKKKPIRTCLSNTALKPRGSTPMNAARYHPIAQVAVACGATHPLYTHTHTQHDVTHIHMSTLISIESVNNNQSIIYNGGKTSLQFGHMSRYRIHPSRHPVWKICRQGVTIYCLRCRIILVPPMPAVLFSSDPEGMTGTSMSCAQMLQSKTFLPLPFDSPALFAAVSSVEDDASKAVGDVSSVVVMLSGIVAPSSSSRRMGW
jgi:hypothetical protein